MCGRYTLYHVYLLKQRFDLLDELEMMPSYNVAPGQTMPVIVREAGNVAVLMKWGLVPPWAEDAASGFKMINARAETLAQRPAYRNAFAKRRCLVPANGFFEWRSEGKSKTPMYVHMKDRGLFSFAGLYERWRDPEGNELLSYAIITTPPNGLMSGIHDRMPAILRPEDEAEWLDAGVSEPARLGRLLAPYPDAEMNAYAVPPDVNIPRNNCPALIEPAAPDTLDFGL